MEMAPSPPVIAKKLWNTLRIMLYMLRKGISKSKLLIDLHMMLKRSKLAGKAIGDLMLHHHQHYAAFGCRSNDTHVSFVSPREYEFSCSNSPTFPSRKHHFRRRRHRDHHQDSDVNVVQKVFDILSSYETVEASPLTLPGFGRSPMVKQLRVTDSPFPLKDTDEDTQSVDAAAEDFIKKFYRELKQQR